MKGIYEVITDRLERNKDTQTGGEEEEGHGNSSSREPCSNKSNGDEVVGGRLAVAGDVVVRAKVDGGAG